MICWYFLRSMRIVYFETMTHVTIGNADKNKIENRKLFQVIILWMQCSRRKITSTFVLLYDHVVRTFWERLNFRNLFERAVELYKNQKVPEWAVQHWVIVLISSGCKNDICFLVLRSWRMCDFCKSDKYSATRKGYH